MSLAARQTLIAAVVGILVVLIVVRLARQDRLSFRYTLGWIGVASIGVLSGLVVPAAEPLGRVLGLSGASVLGLTALIALCVISIQLSISISILQRQVRTLTEEIARRDRQEITMKSPNSNT